MEFNRCYGCMRELEAPGAVCPYCGYDNTNDPCDPVRQPSHVLPCGTILYGKYIVGRSLGQGGFGITYIGFDLILEIPVCIKEYYPEGAAMRAASQSRLVYWGTSETAQSMKASRKIFVKEAQKAVKLRDLSHVVTVWGVFYENETAYIVMDYIEGETLQSRLVRTQHTLSEKECMELLAPVIEDLEEAHKRGIIHRDIKPDNIMLTSEGRPILLDMGSAKDLGKGAQNGAPISSMSLVSHGFSPIEQYQTRGDIGPWTDVYAMCATIYYCVSGKKLLPATDRLVEDTLDFSGFSPSFAELLRKGLSIRAEDRTQRISELLPVPPAENVNPLKERSQSSRLSREGSGVKPAMSAAEVERKLWEIFYEAAKYEVKDAFREELQTLLKGLDIAPDNCLLMLKLGRVYRRLGFYKKALEYYQRAKELDPSNPNVYCNIGAVYCTRDMCLEAKPYYEKAITMIKADPLSVTADEIAIVYGNYARCLGKLGDLKSARQYLSLAKKMGYSKDSIKNTCDVLNLNPLWI